MCVIYACKYLPFKNSNGAKTRSIYFYTLPKMRNGYIHFCFVDNGRNLHRPEAHDCKSSVSNIFEGGLYYPMAVITLASPNRCSKVNLTCYYAVEE